MKYKYKGSGKFWFDGKQIHPGEIVDTTLQLPKYLFVEYMEKEIKFEEPKTTEVPEKKKTKRGEIIW